MTITLLQLLTFIIAVAVFVATPGPGVFAVLAKGMSQGAWSVLPLALGLALGDSIYMVFSAYGLSALATEFHGLFLVIKYLGAVYLFYLAWQLWTQPVSGTAMASVEKGRSGKSFLSGLLISISNPKVILFYVSLLPSFFPVTTLTAIDIALVCAVIFIVAALMMMVYGFLADYAQRKFREPKARQRFNRIGAAFMGLAGGWLLSK